MFTILFIVVLILLILLMVKYMWRNDYYDDEIVTTTTTVVEDTEPLPYQVVGNLNRQYEGKQPFVIDPVDGEKMWVNTKDDMYEDADGKVWKLT